MLMRVDFSQVRAKTPSPWSGGDLLVVQVFIRISTGSVPGENQHPLTDIQKQLVYKY
jgi:hypothetical protein